MATFTLSAIAVEWRESSRCSEMGRTHNLEKKRCQESFLSLFWPICVDKETKRFLTHPRDEIRIRAPRINSRGRQSSKPAAARIASSHLGRPAGSTDGGGLSTISESHLRKSSQSERLSCRQMSRTERITLAISSGFIPGKIGRLTVLFQTSVARGSSSGLVP